MDRDLLVGMIALAVNGGASPRDAAHNFVNAGVSAQAVQEALALFLEKAGLVRSARIPRGMIGANLHESWYLGPTAEHKFWPALKELLQQRNWKQGAIDSIDEASTKILSLLPPPFAQEFTAKGLVLGYVQAGKTANFSALIAKAADVGYRVIIVMSGVTNSLRNQTQSRLNRELCLPNETLWSPLTEARQDFRRPPQTASAFLATHIPASRVLAIVKKNAPVLRKLIKWLGGASREILEAHPVLLIDDECDQASIKASSTPEERSAINALVLELLHLLPRCAYVGYTATPFANLLIDATTQDLYPQDFIISLDPPSNYFGTEQLFGRARLPQDESLPTDGYDMIRIVSEHDADALKAPVGDGVAQWVPEATGALADAIDYFCLATAARRVRGDGHKYSTMLIHTSQRIAVQQRFLAPIQEYLGHLRRRVAQSDSGWLDRLRIQWNTEQSTVSPTAFGLMETPFEQLLHELPTVLASTEVMVENFASRNRLDFTQPARPLIVIGGNVLSRGLTLEELVVSFFLRSATAYDALLQMGRWFGFRDGYEDLPRVWMTEELETWFYDLATVEQEIRYDIDRYEYEGLTPLEFAVRIRTHPDLEITSRLKMQSAVRSRMSFSGRVEQTLRFLHKNGDWLAQNRYAARELVAAIETSDEIPRTQGGTRSDVLYSGVSAERVLTFLSRYQTHPTQEVFRSERAHEYIRAQNAHGELMLWNVVVLNPETQLGTIDLGGGDHFHLMNRSRFERGNDPLTADLKAMMTEGDVVADMPELTPAQRKEGQAKLLVRRFSSASVGKRGLLLLYPISRDSVPSRTREPRRKPLEAVDDVIGLAMVFPKSANEGGSAVDYMTARLPAMTVEEVDPVELENECELAAGDQPMLG